MMSLQMRQVHNRDSQQMEAAAGPAIDRTRSPLMASPKTVKQLLCIFTVGKNRIRLSPLQRIESVREKTHQ